MVMDAAKMGNDAVMAQTEGIAAGLAKTNPVAAAKLLLDANNNAATNLGKAKQQGWFSGKDQQLRQFTMDAQRIGQQAGMLGDDEQADRYLSEARGQQIQEQMSLSTSALNRSGASLNVASSYGAQGQYNQHMASQAAGMSQNYDEMGNQIMTEEASIQEQRMGREQELMLSDRMAQGQVDEYNAGRMGRGIQTGLQIAGTAASMYGGISAGMASNAAADLYGRTNQPNESSGIKVNSKKVSSRPAMLSGLNNVSVKNGGNINSGFLGHGQGQGTAIRDQQYKPWADTSERQGYNPTSYGGTSSPDFNFFDKTRIRARNKWNQGFNSN
jgi:hypothetical protein